MEKRKYLVDFELPTIKAEVYATTYEEAIQLAAKNSGLLSGIDHNEFLVIVTETDETENYFEK